MRAKALNIDAPLGAGFHDRSPASVSQGEHDALRQKRIRGSCGALAGVELSPERRRAHWMRFSALDWKRSSSPG